MAEASETELQRLKRECAEMMTTRQTKDGDTKVIESGGIVMVMVVFRFTVAGFRLGTVHLHEVYRCSFLRTIGI